jgi:hypothetical protein
MQIFMHHKFKTNTTTDQEALIMIKYSKSSMTSSSAQSLLSRESQTNLVEEEIKQVVTTPSAKEQEDHPTTNSKEQQEEEGQGASDTPLILLPVSVSPVIQSQEVFRIIPSASIRRIKDSNHHDNYDMPRENVVSYYASDIDDCEMSDDPDPTTPLDYRRHWSFERQNKLQVILLSNALLQESIVDNNDLDDDDMMDCKSIASIDVGSDYGDEINSPMSQWIHGEDIIW